jgi:hypothetical protein
MTFIHGVPKYTQKKLNSMLLTNDRKIETEV